MKINKTCKKNNIVQSIPSLNNNLGDMIKRKQLKSIIPEFIPDPTCNLAASASAFFPLAASNCCASFWKFKKKNT